MVAAGLATAAPAGAAGSPSAQASGVDAPPPLPSLVQTRLTRLEGALERLTEDVNEVDGVHAVKAGKVVRRQLAAAWRGARYYIVHAPAPPAEDARLNATRARRAAARPPAEGAREDRPGRRGPRDRRSGDDGDGRVRRVPRDLEHGDRAHRRRAGPGARRDEPDAVPVARPARQGDQRRAHARAAGSAARACEAAAAQDPRTRSRSTRTCRRCRCSSTTSSSTSTASRPTRPTCGPAATRILTKARAHIVATEATINAFWPPVIED